jgi:hypothetical protein
MYTFLPLFLPIMTIGKWQLKIENFDEEGSGILHEWHLLTRTHKPHNPTVPLPIFTPSSLQPTAVPPPVQISQHQKCCVYATGEDDESMVCLSTPLSVCPAQSGYVLSSTFMVFESQCYKFCYGPTPSPTPSPSPSPTPVPSPTPTPVPTPTAGTCCIYNRINTTSKVCITMLHQCADLSGYVWAASVIVNTDSECRSLCK